MIALNYGQHHEVATTVASHGIADLPPGEDGGHQPGKRFADALLFRVGVPMFLGFWIVIALGVVGDVAGAL